MGNVRLAKEYHLNPKKNQRMYLKHLQRYSVDYVKDWKNLTMDSFA